MKNSNCFSIAAMMLLGVVAALRVNAQEELPPGAVQLDTQVDDLYRAGRYQDAIPIAERALTMRKTTLGENSLDVATSINELALLYQRAGVYAKAESLYQRALAIREKALGQEHPDTAQSLAGLAEIYRILDADAKAEPLYQRALSIRDKVLGPEHPDTAQSLVGLANLYRDSGQFERNSFGRDSGQLAKAEPLYQRALSIREKALGLEHPDTAESLNELAVLYVAMRKYAKAEPLQQRALVIREKILGPEHPDTAKSLDDLATLYVAKDERAKAEPLYQRALFIREKVLGSDHPDTAESLTRLADFYFDLKAEPLYERALAINEKVFGPGHAATADSLLCLASIYLWKSAYTDAEPLYQRALSIYEGLFGLESVRVAILLWDIGGLYAHTGAYANAEPLYQRAFAIYEKVLGPEHIGTAIALMNIATLYIVTGAYTKAEPLYKRALAIQEKLLGPEHLANGKLLMILVNLYRETGAYTKAESLYQQAISMYEKAVGNEESADESLDNNRADVDFSRKAILFSRLGSLYEYTGAYTRAELLYQRALEIYGKVPDQDDLVAASFLRYLANLYEITGEYAKAGPLYQRVLAIVEKAVGTMDPSLTGPLNDLATFYFATGAYLQAEPLKERVQTLDEKGALRFLYSGSESRKQLYVRKRAKRVSADISLSLIHPTTRSTMLGLTSVLQYKGRVLDVMSNSLARLHRSAAPQDRALLDQLATVARELSNLAYRDPEGLSAESYRERMDALIQQQDTLEGQLVSRSAAFSELLAPITLDGVRQALPTDAVLVEWFRYQPFDPQAEEGSKRSSQQRYVAYVLKRAGEPVAIDIGPAQPIEDLIVRFRDALLKPATDIRGATRVPTSRVDVVELAAALSEKLIKPLRPYFSQGERLLISPDGALNLVPFAALLDENGDYLARRFEISYLTSGRDLLRLGDEALSYNDPVIVAAPSYGKDHGVSSLTVALPQSARSADLDRSGMIFNPLPGTTAEAKALQSLLSLRPDQTLTGDRATEAQLRSLHGPRILHLATHGFFLKDEDLLAVFNNSIGWDDQAVTPLRENPLLRSGLALAGANERSSGSTDDGILTAAEVAQLDLVGTQLVVLSACETALGTVDAGVGVYGLRRALALAGAQSQLVSLWKVDDAATQALMTDYYRRLLNGEGRAGALRSVQLSMLADPAHQHPYYWAAFIPIGDWKPLGVQAASKAHIVSGN